MASKTYAHDKRAEKKAQKEILQRLAELGGKVHNDDDITYAGTTLVIPESMTIGRAIDFLEQKQEELEAETDFVTVFNYRPWDGAYCMWNALKRVFGMVAQKPTMGFFGPNPPRMITINTGVDEKEQVPWGAFQLPILPDVTFSTFQSDHDELGPLFGLTASGPKKWSGEIQGIFKIVEDELENNSMYRGKAFDGQTMPEFVDLSGVDREQVVYSAEVMRQLEANIWMPLRHTESLEREGFPLKRAVLVHGPYGTGKTLAAILTGQEATGNGWTFIKGRPGRDDLSYVMQTARLYQPAVVFYEDVDQIADGAVTDESGISRLLDDFDGIDAKGTRILCVLTTNHVDRIHKGMARPGRLDAMIEINNLDQAGLAKLVTARVGARLADDIDWAAVMTEAKDYAPAFVTEFAHRAVLYAMARNDGKTDGLELVTDDLVAAAADLQPQFALMSDAKDRHEPQHIDRALRTVFENVVRENIDEDYLVEANGN